jgi:hypothetical protein
MVYKLQRLEKSFTKQNQLKKESKEMNSKVRAPRLQETKVFVNPKSKSNQDGTQYNMESFKRDERRNMEKESENKKFKTGRQISLTSTTH